MVGGLLVGGAVEGSGMSVAGAVDSEEPSRGSGLFAGFRVLGLYCNHLAHVLRYHRRHREFYLVTAVGKSFHTYNVSRLCSCA